MKQKGQQQQRQRQRQRQRVGGGGVEAQQQQQQQQQDGLFRGGRPVGPLLPPPPRRITSRRRGGGGRKVYFSERDVCLMKALVILAAVSSICGLILVSLVHVTLLETKTTTTSTTNSGSAEQVMQQQEQQRISSFLSWNNSKKSWSIKSTTYNKNNNGSLSAGDITENIIARSPQPRMKSLKEILSSYYNDKNTTEEAESYHENPDLLPYNPKIAPVLEGWWNFKRGRVTPPVANFRPVRIGILSFEHVNQTMPNDMVYLEIKNIVMDGFEKSPYFELVGVTFVPDFHIQPDFFLPETDDIIWVVEERRRVYNVSYTIPAQLHYLVTKTRTWQKEQQQQKQNRSIASVVSLPRLRVVLMDYRDSYYKVTCTDKVHDVIQLLRGPRNLRSVRNMLVEGRKWNPDRNFVDPGELKVSNRDRNCLMHRYLPSMHLAYTVRTDLAEAIEQAYPLFLPSDPNNNDDSMGVRTPCDTERNVDVAHFWPLKKEGVAGVLRHKVTETVLSLQNTTLVIDEEPHERTIKVIGNFVSLAGEEGRTNAYPGYVKALLTTKIVVCAQRDEWEDHYRLFESLSGGALVLTDPMWQLPDGLVDGTHVVVYHSLEDLKKKILFYLQHSLERHRIACAGWRESMVHHRSYHEMERVFFGQQLSPPYIY